MGKEVIGFALCGSFCTYEAALAALEALTREYETVVPILSFAGGSTDFYKE